MFSVVEVTLLTSRLIHITQRISNFLQGNDIIFYGLFTDQPVLFGSMPTKCIIFRSYCRRQIKLAKKDCIKKRDKK